MSINPIFVSFTVFLQNINIKLCFVEQLRNKAFPMGSSRNGYNQIGTIMQCEFWGKRPNEMGDETFVLVETTDNKGNFVEKAIE
ncbi:10417_t:CDS:2 [Gigaspora rosea]|nr:10417_t:CDS:2 [Gigaspora rosea]